MRNRRRRAGRGRRPAAWVVVPTYNERENLPELLPRLLSFRDLHVLVVDDASPDGTGEWVAELAAREPRVRLLRRPGRLGLGSAYVCGFRAVLAIPSAGYILEMDADLSHDPSYLPGMLALAESFDVVLGSRYVPGGEVRDWTLPRRLLSRAGNLYARAWLGLPVRDATGGFRVYRRAVLESIDLDAVRSNGYAFQVEMVHRCHAAGWRIAEMPIAFADRTRGSSKMSARIVSEAVWRVPILRFAHGRAQAAARSPTLRRSGEREPSR